MFGAVFLRERVKYAAVISQTGQYCDRADIERTVTPIREVLARGIRDKVLRDDLPGDAVFEILRRLLNARPGWRLAKS
ncbi:hypothetical protein [Nocardia pseudovaccinii]|uniref:hypothetical protein n=1 Tax=Nocardia pseudovaccinii TaxID=189540 RepID=UPI0007A4D91E|nr:hypothetical protein [Nocardia pseudovaccinii]